MTQEPVNPLVLQALLRVLAREQSKKAKFVQWLEGVFLEDATSNAVIPFEPWPHLVERAEAWDAGNSEDILKARQEGFSWGLAAFAVYKARKASTNILVISQGQRESYEFLRKCRFIAEHHKDWVKLQRANQSELEVADGGVIRALPSTEDAGRGFTATLVIVDEAAFHPYAELNYQAYYPTIGDGGQLITVSTSAGPQGWFYRRFQAARANDDAHSDDKAHKKRAIFVPWYARPGRDGAWYANTLAQLGDDGFKREYPATIEEAFAASSGLALPFDAQKHVRPDHPVPWESCKVRIAGFDPGGDDPTAVVLLGMYRTKQGNVRWHQYGEMYRTGTVSIDDIVSYLYEHKCLMLVGDFGPQSPYVGQFRRYGIKAYGAKKNREVQWRKHAEVLRDQRLTIHESCESIKEYYSYWWDDKTAVPFATKTGEDHHADAIQAREYAMVFVENALNRGELGGIDKVNLRYTERKPQQVSAPRVKFAKR